MSNLFAATRLANRAAAGHNRRQQADAFLWQWLGAGLALRARTINRRLQNVRLVTPAPFFTPLLSQAILTARPDWRLAPTGQTSPDAIIMLGVPTITHDVPALLRDCQQALAEGGLFLCGFFGGNTLAELRTALLQAEAQVRGGAATRIAPMIDATSASQLLQRAGFTLPVVDHETLTTRYSGLAALRADLHAANAHAVLQHVEPWPRALTAALANHYSALCAQLYPQLYLDAPAGWLATWQGLFLSGWKS